MPDTLRNEVSGGAAEPDKWLTAHHDPVAGLHTFSSCMALADLSADGEVKLIIADLGSGSHNMKLKVYKGTQLSSENTLIDMPTGVITFHMDTTEPQLPAVAVASGSYIYIYKNLRPYFKFTLPTLEVNPLEYDAWNQARDDLLDVSLLYEILDSLRHEVGECGLTTRSQRFLMCPDHQSQQTFLDQHKGFLLKRQTVVTAIATLKKSYAEDDAISCLVLGTESANIFILDPEAFTILNSVSLPSVAVFLSVMGLYDVEYRIIVACRNGHVYTLKRGTKVGRPTIELNSQAVGLVRRDKSIFVATMDKNLHCYSNKGKRLWSQEMDSLILCLELIEIKALNLRLVAVALEDRRVLIFKDKHIVDTICTEAPVSAMLYGRFGREDNSFILVMRGADPPLIKLRGGSMRPGIPPSIFNVPASCLPSPKLIPRPAKVEDQQLKYFLQKYKITSFDAFKPERNLQKQYRNLIISRSKERLVCLFMTDNFSECSLSVIVENKPTLCFPLTLSAFKNGISVPLFKTLHPNNGLRFYPQFDETVRLAMHYDIPFDKTIENDVTLLQGHTSACVDTEKEKKLAFLTRQLELLLQKQFSMNDYCFAFQSYPKCNYEQLRDCLVLPCKRKLKRKGLYRDSV
ncbi:Bardet-Biedl syndrome 1 N-terminal [Trinorchestia longiramus]|nr:Bardet-Biedl syndrome 1 N-terminal [Trinorchestia longiramus]